MLQDYSRERHFSCLPGKTYQNSGERAIIFPRRYPELIYVNVQPNESIDSALKRFNLKMQASGVLRELKEHAHYEKPSEKRRRSKRRQGRM